MNCSQCNKTLTGRQRKYCCKLCKRRKENRQFYDSGYIKQRGINKKNKLIELSGGKCNRCGYNKCIACLAFHHINPKIKRFTLDMANLNCRSWESVMLEHAKCELLCMNCHTELHYREHNPL